MTDAEFAEFVREAAEAQTREGLANVGRCDRSRWCECSHGDSDQDSYYETKRGVHGWFHDPAKGGCGGVTQSG
jgi:hypothetical protein